MNIHTHPCLKLNLIALMLCITHSINAETLAIEIGNKNLNLSYQQVIDTGYAWPLLLDTSLLYTEQHDHQDLLAGLGLLLMPKKPHPNLNFAAGFKGFITDVLDYRVGAIALGGMLKYSTRTQSPLEAQASVYYAPTATSTMDGEYFQLIDLAIDYQLNQGSSLRLGYRDINAGINNAADAELDQGAYLGWLINF